MTEEMIPTKPIWDVFLSYASEERVRVAIPLANYLIKRGLLVWFDLHQLEVGDSLRARIDEGLSQSRFAVVVLSKAFFGKHWTIRELNGLGQREVAGTKVILPVWCDVDEASIRNFSLPLADRVGVPWSLGLEEVATRLLRTIRPGAPTSDGAASGADEALESPLLAALEKVSYEVLDDEFISGLMAETNASGFFPDDIQILTMGPLDLATVSATFEASIHFSGEQDPDHTFHGDTISSHIKGTIRFDGSDWEVDTYEVVSAEIEGMDYEPDDK